MTISVFHDMSETTAFLFGVSEEVWNLLDVAAVDGTDETDYQIKASFKTFPVALCAKSPRPTSTSLPTPTPKRARAALAKAQPFFQAYLAPEAILFCDETL